MPKKEKETRSFYILNNRDKPLTRAREKELAIRIEAGDNNALDELVRCNMTFVVSVALEYKHYGLPVQDLISEGALGATHAARKFDYRRGFKFISYARWWVVQYIQRGIMAQAKVFNCSCTATRWIGPVTKIRERLFNTGQKVTAEVIAEIGDIPLNEVSAVLAFLEPTLELNVPVKNDGDGYSRLDAIPDTSFLDEAGTLEDRLMVNRLLESLSGKETDIIDRYYGLTNGAPETLDEIGLVYNVTRERIRQIKEKALVKVRKRQKLAVYRKAVE